MKTIPIKSILLGETTIQQLEEFEFIRNNPVLATLGAATLGGAIVNDYHNHDYHSAGKYIGDKMDSLKSAIGGGIEKTRSSIHDITKPDSPRIGTIPKPANIQPNTNI